jgi:hypothetical protein
MSVCYIILLYGVKLCVGYVYSRLDCWDDFGWDRYVWYGCEVPGMILFKHT